MFLSVKPAASLAGEVEAPPSKSATHRAFVAAALSAGESRIRDPLLSDDTRSTLAACEAFGAETKESDGGVLISGFDGKSLTPNSEIDVGNSGTTLRIMTAIASLCSGEVVLTGDASIRKRPMQPLLSALEQLGVGVSSRDGMPPVCVKGPLQGGSCRIRGDVSSQFISGLLFACPLAPKDTRIDVEGRLFSEPYVEMTLEVLRSSGVRVDSGKNVFFVPGNQRYAARDFGVEGDYSSAAFVLAAAALSGGSVRVSNLSPDSKQGDQAIVRILEEMGAKVLVKDDSVRVEGGELSGAELDMSATPDLVPIVAVLGALAEGRTLIKNVPHLRYKESDRLKAMAVGLSRMGAKVEEREDGLEIVGASSLRGARVSGCNDHRVVMALSVAALAAQGETVIDSAEAIGVSFPDFIAAMKKIGADMTQK